MDTLFFVTIVCTTFTLPYSTIGFVVGAALSPMVIIMVTVQHNTKTDVEKCEKRSSVLSSQRLRRTSYQNDVEFQLLRQIRSLRGKTTGSYVIVTRIQILEYKHIHVHE
jgi:hypothetical protein